MANWCNSLAPWAFDANTDRSIWASWRSKTASASKPAACHTPKWKGRSRFKHVANRRISAVSPTLHTIVFTCRPATLAAKALGVEPERETTKTEVLLRFASQREVIKPSPPVPPVTM